jgi:hypothetical protein
MSGMGDSTSAFLSIRDGSTPALMQPSDCEPAANLLISLPCIGQLTCATQHHWVFDQLVPASISNDQQSDYSQSCLYARVYVRCVRRSLMASQSQRAQTSALIPAAPTPCKLPNSLRGSLIVLHVLHATCSAALQPVLPPCDQP